MIKTDHLAAQLPDREEATLVQQYPDLPEVPQKPLACRDCPSSGTTSTALHLSKHRKQTLGRTEQRG